MDNSNTEDRSGVSRRGLMVGALAGLGVLVAGCEAHVYERGRGRRRGPPPGHRRRRRRYYRSSNEIDRALPHQVEVAGPQRVSESRMEALHAGAEAIDRDHVACLTGDGTGNAVRFCFGDRASAQAFQRRFAGRLLTAPA